MPTDSTDTLASRLEAAAHGPDHDYQSDDDDIELLAVDAHGEAPSSSEETDDDEGDGDLAADDDASSDEEKSTGEATGDGRSERQAGTGTVGRLLRNMRVKERELAQEREDRRQDRTELVRLQGRVRELEDDGGGRDDGDPVEALVSAVLRRLGAKSVDDPRFREAFKDAVTQATAEAYNTEDSGGALRSVREERQRGRAERQRFKAYDDRIKAMEVDRLKAMEQAQSAQLESAAMTYMTVNEAKTPYLRAAAAVEGFSPAELIVQAARAMVDSKQAPDPTSMKALGELYAVVAGNYERHFKALAAGLRDPGGKSAAGIGNRNNQSQAGSVQRVAPSSKAGGSDARVKARDTRGGGGRGSAAQQTQAPDDDGPGDLASRIARAERLARRTKRR